MTRLINSTATDMLNQVNEYKKTIQDAFYEHYKNIYILTETNNFRGKGADAYKEYFTRVTINYINAFINIAEEVSTTFVKMNSNYTALESNEKGSIDTDILVSVKGSLSSKNESFQSLAAEIDLLNNEAASYISVESLNTSDIIGEYTSIDSELSNIGNELTSVDSSSLVEVNTLMSRIDQLTFQLKTIANDYHEGNKISVDKVKEITNQGWYKAECSDSLGAMIKVDPFCYASDAKYYSENQWAIGFLSDTYMYGGYSTFGGEYNGSINKGVASGKLSASLFNVYGNAQLSKYAKANANISVVDLALSGKAGLSKEYAGLQGNGSVALAKANASVVLGSDEFNGYIKGNASVLSADGYVNGYCNSSNGDFDIGIGGKASVADASVTAGISLFNVPGNKVKNGNVTKSTSLLGASITGSAGGSIGADFDISSTRVLDFGEVNVNALHVKLGGAFGLGFDVELTVPIPMTDMPWED